MKIYHLLPKSSLTILLILLFSSSSYSQNNPEYPIWVQVFTTSQPPIENFQGGFVYDTTGDQLIQFGGKDTINNAYNITRTLNLTSREWVDRNPLIAPDARFGIDMIYDTQNDQTIIFGGSNKASKTFNDTWSYNANTNIWNKINSINAPQARYLHSMAYDPTTGDILLFGGSIGPFQYTFFDDTWKFNTNSNVWTNLNTTVAPSGRDSSALVFDKSNNRFLLHGGLAVSGYFVDKLNDLWAYYPSNNSWVELNPTGAIGATMGHGLVYDDARETIIKYGGLGSSSITNAAMEYNSTSNSWNFIELYTLIDARFHPSMAYNTKIDKIFMFGGQISGFSDASLWILNMGFSLEGQEVLTETVTDTSTVTSILTIPDITTETITETTISLTPGTDTTTQTSTEVITETSTFTSAKSEAGNNQFTMILILTIGFTISINRKRK